MFKDICGFLTDMHMPASNEASVIFQIPLQNCLMKDSNVNYSAATEFANNFRAIAEIHWITAFNSI